MKSYPLLFAFAALALASCGSSTSSSSSYSSLSLYSPPASTSYPSIAAPEDTYLDFFSPDKTPEITIEGSKEALSFISDNQCYKDMKFNDAYLPMTVRFEYEGKVYVYENAGVRMKGNTSRAEFYKDGQFFGPVHFKVNLKATFDSEIFNDPALAKFRVDWTGKSKERTERKDRKFLGLEKFDLKYVPRNVDGEDYSAVREIYAYHCFEEQGILAPKASLCVVNLTDGETGFSYAAEVIEPIDKQFLKRRLSKDEAKGDLYKCVYNAMGKADFSRSGAIEKEGDNAGTRLSKGKIGVEDNYHYYVPCYQLKTNDDLGEGADFSKMANLIHSLWRCVYDGEGKDLLERTIDVEEFLSFSAVAYLLGGFDDQRYNMNNFYVYFRPSDGKAMFLPYDWDWCLGLDMGHDMTHLRPLDDWTLCNSRSNLYDATILSNDNVSYSLLDYQQRYLADVDEYKSEVLDGEKYRGFAGLFGLEGIEETGNVVQYMNAKLSYCA